MIAYKRRYEKAVIDQTQSYYAPVRHVDAWRAGYETIGRERLFGDHQHQRRNHYCNLRYERPKNERQNPFVLVV